MTFYTSTLMSTLVENLQLVLDNVRDKIRLHEVASSKPRLLVLDSGCHDLAFNNSAMYIAHFKEVFNLLEEITNTNMFKIVWQNIPPWPHELEHNNDRHLNSFVNAATAYWVSKKLEQLDIPIVDMRSIALPFEDMSVCGMHYICHDFPREHKGIAGREAAQQVLRVACL